MNKWMKMIQWWMNEGMNERKWMKERMNKWMKHWIK